MCSPPKIRGALCKGLARGPHQLLSDASTRGRGLSATPSSALDTQVQPKVRNTVAALLLSHTSKRRAAGGGERGKNINGMMNDDRTFEGLGPGVSEVSHWGGGISSSYGTSGYFIQILQ